MNSSFKSFRTVLDQLESEDRFVDVFFRDDDIDVKEDSLRRLLEVFLSHAVPVNLEVIPGRLTEDAIEWLLTRRRAHPVLIELNQHGWMHVNHEFQGKKCEFGSARGFEEQFVDIARGKARMDEAFPGQWHPVFTPPWNRCTADTFLVLEQLGFRVLSRDWGKGPVTAYKFAEISTSLDLHRWKGSTTLKAPEEVSDELGAQLLIRPRVGILLHHKAMTSTELALLALLLEALRKCSKVRVHTFEGMLRECGGRDLRSES